jgi:hypothetical protein
MPARVREAMQPHPPLLLRLTMLPLMTDRAAVTAHALDAPSLPADERAFPVVLLKPALGAAVAQSSVLAEDLASHGYVIVGSDSPHTTPGVAYPDGRIVMQTPAGHPSENAPGPTSDLVPGQPNDFYLPVLDAWVKDERFILDRLRALNEMDPDGRFTHRLDLGSVGAIGHSFGGATALQFCREDRGRRSGRDDARRREPQRRRKAVPVPLRRSAALRHADSRRAGRRFLAALERIRASIPGSPSLLLPRGAQHVNFFDQALLTEPTVWRWFGAMGPRRLIPLMDAIPAWLHVVLVAAGVCYLVTAVCLLARRRAASPVLLAGVTIELCATALSRPILAAVGVVVTPDPPVLAAVLLPVVFPLLLAAAAWSGSRRGSDLLRARWRHSVVARRLERRRFREEDRKHSGSISDITSVLGRSPLRGRPFAAPLFFLRETHDDDK